MKNYGWIYLREVTPEDLRLINKKAQEFIDRHQLGGLMPEEAGSPFVRLEGILWFPHYRYFKAAYYRRLWYRILERAFGKGVRGVAYGYLGRPR